MASQRVGHSPTDLRSDLQHHAFRSNAQPLHATVSRAVHAQALDALVRAKADPMLASRGVRGALVWAAFVAAAVGVMVLPCLLGAITPILGGVGALVALGVLAALVVMEQRALRRLRARIDEAITLLAYSMDEDLQTTLIDCLVAVQADTSHVDGYVRRRLKAALVAGSPAASPALGERWRRVARGPFGRALDALPWRRKAMEPARVRVASVTAPDLTSHDEVTAPARTVEALAPGQPAPDATRSRTR